jgi:hypothetical protein
MVLHTLRLDKLELIEDDRLVFILRHADPTLDWRSFVNGEPDTWVYANAVVAMQRQNGRVKARSVYEDELERSALISMSVIPCTCPTSSMSRLLSSGTRQCQYHKQKECMHFSFQDNR